MAAQKAASFLGQSPPAALRGRIYRKKAGTQMMNRTTAAPRRRFGVVRHWSFVVRGLDIVSEKICKGLLVICV